MTLNLQLTVLLTSSSSALTGSSQGLTENQREVRNSGNIRNIQETLSPTPQQTDTSLSAPPPHQQSTVKETLKPSIQNIQTGFCADWTGLRTVDRIWDPIQRPSVLFHLPHRHSSVSRSQQVLQGLCLLLGEHPDAEVPVEVWFEGGGDDQVLSRRQFEARADLPQVNEGF